MDRMNFTKEQIKFERSSGFVSFLLCVVVLSCVVLCCLVLSCTKMSTTGAQCLSYNGTVCKDVISWSTTWVKDTSEDYMPWSSQRDVDKLEEELKRMFTIVNLTLPLNPLTLQH